MMQDSQLKKILFVLYELIFTKIYSRQYVIKVSLIITISKCYRRMLYLETYVRYRPQMKQPLLGPSCLGCAGVLLSWAAELDDA